MTSLTALSDVAYFDALLMCHEAEDGEDHKAAVEGRPAVDQGDN